MALNQFTPGQGTPNVSGPLESKDALAQLLNIYENTRGSRPLNTETPVSPGQVYSRYRPPGQMRSRFPWARPNRGA